MNSPLDTPAFLFIWMCFPLLMCAALIAFFLWGVRSGQFSDQERARYLALHSGIPGSDVRHPPSQPPPSGGRSLSNEGEGRGGGRCSG